MRTALMRAAGVWLLGAGLAGAATNYVALSGDGSDGASWTTAWTNVHHAFDAALDGDAILVQTGTYVVTNQLTIGPGTNITVRGGYLGDGEPGNRTDDAGQTVFLRPQGLDQSGLFTMPDTAAAYRFRILLITGAGGVVDGLTLAGGYVYGDHGGCLKLVNATTLLTNCVIRNGSTAGYWNSANGVGVAVIGGAPVFDRCEIRDNIPQNHARGVGLYVNNGSVTMRHSVIRDNMAQESGGGNDSSGAGAYFTGTGTNHLFNCLVVCNHSQALIDYDGLYSDARLLIENCTIANNHRHGIYATALTVISNSIVWNNGDDISGAPSISYSCVEDTDVSGVGVIHTTPDFVYGYYLGPNTTCADAGGGAASGDLSTRFALATAADTGTVDLGYHGETGFTPVRTNLYVATNGVDNIDGGYGFAPATPFRTITYAIAQAEKGSTITLAAGRYGHPEETFPLTVHGRTLDGLRIEGAGPTSTVVDAVGSTQIVMRVRGMNGGAIRNLALTGGKPTGLKYWNGVGVNEQGYLNGRVWYGAGLNLNGYGTAVEDCAIYGNEQGATWRQAGGVFLEFGNPVLTRCDIYSNRSGSYGTRGGGVFALGGEPLLDSCKIRLNRCPGVTGAAYGGGYFSDAATFGRMRNCLVVRNVSDQAGYGDGIYATRLILENCTVADNNGGEGLVGGPAVFATNCIFWGNGDDLVGIATSQLANCSIEDTDLVAPTLFNRDPLFEYGYYLGAGSACIDAGAGTAAAAGLTNLFARAAEADTGAVDLGYHAPAGYTLVRTNLFVGPTGTDGAEHGSSPAAPFRTIGYALGVAEVGATIQVAAGLYTNRVETFPLNFRTDAVKIIGDHASNTVIDASGANSRVMVVSNVGRGGLLKNLTFTGGKLNVAYVNGSGLLFDNCGLRVENCAVQSNVYATYWGYGVGLSVECGTPWFTDCRIEGNSDAPYYNYAAGLHVNVAAATFERCVIAGNNGYGNGGAFFAGQERSRMINCLVVTNNSRTAGYSGGINAAGYLTLLNCTVADNLGGGVKGVATTAITNSILWGNGDDLVGVTDTNRVRYTCIEDGDFNGTNGCVNADPLFVDRIYFHLQSPFADYRGGYFTGGTWGKSAAMSPLIDAGHPLSDWSQEPDYPKGRINIGAYGNTSVASRGSARGGTLLMLR